MIGHCFDTVAVLRNPSNIGLRTEKLAQKIASSQLKDNYKRGLNCFFDYLEILSRWDMNIERTFLSNQLFNKNNQKGKITRSQVSHIRHKVYCNILYLFLGRDCLFLLW